MSTKVVESFSAQDTKRLGYELGRQVEPGQVYTLIGDLGVGYEDYVYGKGVSLIEWANLIEEILPEKYCRITIEKDLEKGFDYRKITFEEIGA